ncbi:MAG: amidase [Bacteroidota bacterium]
MPVLPTIATHAATLQSRQISSVELVKACLKRINAPDGEGDLAFVHVDADQALAAAAASDRLRAAGIMLSPLMGLPVSVKDLFDIAGQVTRAGSRVLAEAPAATKDATCIARLRRAGAIPIGRTNMTEFAYSGLGLNPHYGTPASPYDRTTRRIPGGSSSGAGVSVADQMAVFGIGTDTGGSVRIPAALCNLTGFKPSTGRVPTAGVLPLSTTYDSVGPLAPSVACCVTVDQVMTDQPTTPLVPRPLNHLRLAIPTGIAMEGLDNHVATAFARAAKKLEAAGAHIQDVQIDAITDPSRPGNGGRLLAAEAYAWHRHYLEASYDMYDPRVSGRMMPASETSAADYIALLGWRRQFLQDVAQTLTPYDALILPTTPITAPPISLLEESEDAYFANNVLMLRNTSIINQIDGCALSIPCHAPNEPPVGFMLAGTAMQDQQILQSGLSVESVLRAL